MGLWIFFSHQAQAYQPGVEELENTISSLESRSEILNLSDSLQLTEFKILQDSISSLKDQIIELNQETIDSLRRQRSLEGNDRSFVNTAAFFLLLITLLCGTFLFAFRNRLRSTESVGLVKLLAGDITRQHAPEKESDPAKRKVHFLVALSVALMFGSLLMYLWRVM